MRKRERVQKFFFQPSLTKPEFKDACDFNKVIKRFMKTGVLDHARHASEARYADLIGSVDYQASLERIREADASFMRLPALIRGKFENDPVKFLEFVSDPKNVNEMVDLGLANPKPSSAGVVQPQSFPVTPPLPS